MIRTHTKFSLQVPCMFDITFRKNILNILSSAGFHDCVGGCDGCLNLVNPQNAGLDITVTALEQIYQTNVLGAGIVLSRADFWSLSSIAGVNAGIKNANYRCPEGFPL